MTIRIRSITIKPRRLTPAEADLIVRVELTGPADGIRAQGKLVGPKCPGSTTVEVAYSLAPASGTVGDETLLLRCAIPEPNLWSATTPFHYQGRVEVFQDAKCLDSQAFAVELRL